MNNPSKSQWAIAAVYTAAGVVMVLQHRTLHTYLTALAVMAVPLAVYVLYAQVQRRQRRNRRQAAQYTAEYTALEDSAHSAERTGV